MPEIIIQIVIVYLVIINSAAIIVTCLDKSRAKRHLWRVPEDTLLLISLLGGSISMLMTMLIIRHKTRHVKFMLGIPAVIAVQLAAVFLILKLSGAI